MHEEHWAQYCQGIIKIYYLEEKINMDVSVETRLNESVYPKGHFRFFDKLKNGIQNSILRFCFYFNKEDEIQITDNHFHV